MVVRLRLCLFLIICYSRFPVRQWPYKHTSPDTLFFLFINRFLWVVQRNLVHGEEPWHLHRNREMGILHVRSASVDRMPAAKRRLVPHPHPPMLWISVKVKDIPSSMCQVWSNDTWLCFSQVWACSQIWPWSSALMGPFITDIPWYTGSEAQFWQLGQLERGKG